MGKKEDEGGEEGKEEEGEVVRREIDARREEREVKRVVRRDWWMRRARGMVWILYDDGDGGDRGEAEKEGGEDEAAGFEVHFVTSSLSNSSARSALNSSPLLTTYVR